MRTSNIEVLGPNVMQRVRTVGGRDEEGEVRGLFRPCGHPGVWSSCEAGDRVTNCICVQLWFAGGDFAYARVFSKSLVSVCMVSGIRSSSYRSSTCALAGPPSQSNGTGHSIARYGVTTIRYKNNV